MTITLVLVGCGPAKAPEPPRVYDVQVDAKASSFSLAASLYFPREVEAHAGDTIRFTAIDRGEIHTVTLGTLVDAALEALAKVPAGVTQPSLESLKLPPVFLGSPPAQLGRSAAQPCFIDSGVAPSPEACPKEQRQEDFTGKQSLFNSGYLPGAAVFAVRLSDSIRPGTYRYLCLLHGPEMAGRIVVVEKDRTVPAPAEVRDRGLAELASLVRALQPAVDAAPGGLPNATLVAGVPARDLAHTQATVFAPAEVAVRVGETLTWKVSGPHTISFNAPQDAVGLVIRASDGGWSLNARALAPEKSSVRPSGAPGGPRTLDSGAWDGRGFRSSGLIVSVAPALVSYAVAFSEPGTYSYKCLIHPDMEGVVKVGQ